MASDLRPIQVMLRLAKKAPRPFAAVWFSVFGFLTAAVMFLRPAVAGGLIAACLYLVLPTVSAGLVGYFWGASILDSGKTKGYFRAFLRSLWLTVLTFAVFATLFVVVYSLSREHGFLTLREAFGLLFAIVTWGFLLAAPLIFSAGAIAATILHAVGRHTPIAGPTGTQIES